MTEEHTDTRERDDPTRLAEERAAQIEKEAAEIRAVAVPSETEPPTIFRA